MAHPSTSALAFRALIERRGLTHQAVAEELGAHRASVTEWSLGIKRPSAKYRLRIARWSKRLGREIDPFGWDDGVTTYQAIQPTGTGG